MESMSHIDCEACATLRARVAELETAGRAVTDSPHQVYRRSAQEGDQYWIGVADGHRKAAMDYHAVLAGKETP